MATAKDIVQQVYAAFGRQDVPAILGGETHWLHVFTVRDGRITRWCGFFDTAARYRV